MHGLCRPSPRGSHPRFTSSSTRYWLSGAAASRPTRSAAETKLVLAVDCRRVKAAVELARVEQAERVCPSFELNHAGDVFDHAALFDDVAVRIRDVDADFVTEANDRVDFARVRHEQRW